MALLAKQRRTGLEHGRNRSAMHVVAIGAVFGHRIMLVHKRAAFFSVAGVAGVIDAVALEQLGAGRAMRVMAIGADHFAFRHRVMRRPVHLGALFFVAGVANLGLGGALSHLVVIVMNLVAGTT